MTYERRAWERTSTLGKAKRLGCVLAMVKLVCAGFGVVGVLFFSTSDDNDEEERKKEKKRRREEGGGEGRIEMMDK